MDQKNPSRHQPATATATVPPAGEGFSNRLRDITEELAAMGSQPLRLAQIDTRLVRFGEIEDETLISEEQYQRMSGQQRRVFDEFIDELHRQRATVRSAYTQPGVIADAFDELEASWRERHGDHVDRTSVLVVLHAYPVPELLTVTARAATVLPQPGTGRQSSSRGGVLLCQAWYHQVLLEELGHRSLGEPLRNLPPEEQEAILALWDDEPSSEFHDLGHVLDAVRRLG